MSCSFIYLEELIAASLFVVVEVGIINFLFLKSIITDFFDSCIRLVKLFNHLHRAIKGEIDLLETILEFFRGDRASTG